MRRAEKQAFGVIRAHLGGFGFGVPKGIPNIERLGALAETTGLFANARNSIQHLAEQFRDIMPERVNDFETTGF